MVHLRFHRSLYSTAAIDKAVEVFVDHARCTRSVTGEYTELELSPLVEGVDEDELAGELANHVLVATVEEKRSR